VTQVVVIQPTKQLHTPTATWSTATNLGLGYLSPALIMDTQRAAHTATLLPDGKVLIAGGFRQEGTSEFPIAEAEIYDPQTNIFTPTGDMNEARTGHTATLLPNGLVLIVGGWSEDGRTATTELYDPQTGKFRYAASLFGPRASMTATLLQNGQLLIAGGDAARNSPQLTAEIYDPGANIFTQSGRLHDGRSAHTATLLPDGSVLFIGGTPNYDDATVLASAELYNPATGEFTYTNDMNIQRYKHAAVLLQDGNVLVIGGSNHQDWTGKYISAEMYNTSTGTFTPMADMNSPRFKLADAAVLLPSGDVLVGGGSRQIERFDAQNQRFIASGTIDNDYYFSVVTLLKDGRALITGGYDANIQPSKKAWIYTSK
jgi:WD40 repeat protein